MQGFLVVGEFADELQNERDVCLGQCAAQTFRLCSALFRLRCLPSAVASRMVGVWAMILAVLCCVVVIIATGLSLVDAGRGGVESRLLLPSIRLLRPYQGAFE